MAEKKRRRRGIVRKVGMEDEFFSKTVDVRDLKHGVHFKHGPFGLLRIVPEIGLDEGYDEDDRTVSFDVCLTDMALVGPMSIVPVAANRFRVVVGSRRKKKDGETAK